MGQYLIAAVAAGIHPISELQSLETTTSTSPGREMHQSRGEEVGTGILKGLDLMEGS